MKQNIKFIIYKAFLILVYVFYFRCESKNTCCAAIIISGNLTASSGLPYNGTDDPWATNNLTVGNTSPGSITIGNGSVLKNQVNANVALFASASTSSVVVTGSGSQWNNTGNLTIGSSGTGTLLITDGGYVSNLAGGVGINNGAKNSVVNVGGGSGTSTWACNNTLTVDGKLNVNGGGVATCTGLTISDGGTVTVGNNSGPASITASGSIFFTTLGGTLNINTGGFISGVRLSSGITNNTINIDGGELQITGTDDADNTVNLLAAGGTLDLPTSGSQLTFNRLIAGAGKLTKTGPGSLVLKNGNSYSNGTTINGGIVLANNTTGSATGSGGITVNDGGVFGGTGAITGSVTVNAGGTVTGGGFENVSIGALLLTDTSCRINTKASFTGAFGADLISAHGTVTLSNSILDISLASAPPTSQTTFLIVTNDGSDAINGTFGAIIAPVGYNVYVDYHYVGRDPFGFIGDGNDIAVTLVAIPEPSSIALIVCGAGLSIFVFRKCKLQLA